MVANIYLICGYSHFAPSLPLSFVLFVNFLLALIYKTKPREQQIIKLPMINEIARINVCGKRKYVQCK